MNGDTCADYTREAIVIFKSWMIIMKNRIIFHVRRRAYSGSGIHANAAACLLMRTRCHTDSH